MEQFSITNGFTRLSKVWAGVAAARAAAGFAGVAVRAGVDAGASARGAVVAGTGLAGAGPAPRRDAAGERQADRDGEKPQHAHAMHTPRIPRAPTG